ncbi:MAG: histidinol dehydrogenase [Kiritimatiellia bacterium]
MKSARIVKWQPNRFSPAVDAFLRRPAFDPAAEAAAAMLLDDIRKRGDTAILAAARRFDGARLTPATLRVTPTEQAAATHDVSAAVRRAVTEACRRVASFARAGLRRDWRMPSGRGGSLGEQFMPLDRVGVYVPGGTAPLASTAVMTATLARVAGVPEIVACTPCGASGRVNPVLLQALQVAGATEIYKVGGIQAIGLMAFGTRRIRPVQKIVGPGNAYVTAAKRQVFGYVAIDQVAGPSEIAVLADASANPAWVAADLLSQAEHGSGHERALLVTDSARLAAAVQAELNAQIPKLSRAALVRRVLPQGVLLVVTPNLDAAVELCRRFAPEHLEVITRRPRQLLPRLRAAGAIFVGGWTPEPVGDFVAGPSHVLPTGGAARMFSGLTVEDFRRRSSVIEYTRRDLAAALATIETFGAVEGLDAHSRSATVRFEGGGPK